MFHERETGARTRPSFLMNDLRTMAGDFIVACGIPGLLAPFHYAHGALRRFSFHCDTRPGTFDAAEVAGEFGEPGTGRVGADSLAGLIQIKTAHLSGR